MGDIPFGPARLKLARELIARLSDAGFRGVVRLDASQRNAAARLNQRVEVTLLPAHESAQASASQSRDFK